MAQVAPSLVARTATGEKQAERVAALEKQAQEIAALKRELVCITAALARLEQPERVARNR